CTIINVQGRKSRWRDADDVERLVRANLVQGVFRFFITDDNFARNRNWEAIFDRLIEMREREGLGLQFIIQVDTLCHRIPNFVEKAARAGCKRVFIGLENINPDNLLQAKKKQNRVHEYRQMFLAWRAQRVITYAGYILGFPGDKPVRLLNHILQFYFTFIQENMHPLQGGYFRRKLRRERRAGLPCENPLVFYTRRICEVLETHVKLAAFYLHLHRIRRRVERDP